MNRLDGSNAETLAELFPQSGVVKAFKWCLRGRCRAELMMEAGREVEEAPLHLFPTGAAPSSSPSSSSSLFYGYLHPRVLPFIDKGENNFTQLPLVAVNRAMPAVALVTLALVYLPGLAAAVLSSDVGPSISGFRSGWTSGCAGGSSSAAELLCAGLHAVYSLCLTLRRAAAHAAERSLPPAGVENSWVEQQVWRSDLYLSCGILGFGVLALLAVTSLPSVGNALNWREFTFVQSGLGYAALTLSVMHTLFFGGTRLPLRPTRTSSRPCTCWPSSCRASSWSGGSSSLCRA
ncbi:Metalloreductase STEAP3 [Larimichthys crocea]|uniref:Metalloreductase STEAP3 n=1 Tax=Larimichthys crocea TaxID=215358 RepID=A0A6G0HES3_LARCR|nr:Metalloreductase STEAP3 [Larimichthys crocea]